MNFRKLSYYKLQQTLNNTLSDLSNEHNNPIIDQWIHTFSPADNPINLLSV